MSLLVALAVWIGGTIFALFITAVLSTLLTSSKADINVRMTGAWLFSAILNGCLILLILIKYGYIVWI